MVQTITLSDEMEQKLLRLQPQLMPEGDLSDLIELLVNGALRNSEILFSLKQMSIKTRYEVWNCDNCDFEYHEKDGLPEEGIEPGTTLDSLPDDWVCPKCGGPKDEFASWAEHEETM